MGNGPPEVACRSRASTVNQENEATECTRHTLFLEGRQALLAYPLSTEWRDRRLWLSASASTTGPFALMARNPLGGRQPRRLTYVPAGR